MTTQEHAARIRADLKMRGISSRQVSVISDLYSMGSSIRIKIKDGAVSKELVETIANPSESVRRCEYSGEILSGGNRFVFVDYSSEALATRRAPFMDAVNRAGEELAKQSDKTLVEIVPGVRLGKNGYNRFSVWADNGHEGEYWDLTAVANKVADLAEKP